MTSPRLPPLFALALSASLLLSGSAAADEPKLESMELFEGHFSGGGGFQVYLADGTDAGLTLGLFIHGGVTHELSDWARWDFVGGYSMGMGSWHDFVGNYTLSALTGPRLGTSFPVRLVGGVGANFLLATGEAKTYGGFNLGPVFRFEGLQKPEQFTGDIPMGFFLEARLLPTYSIFSFGLQWGMW